MGWKLEAFLIGALMVVIGCILYTINHLTHLPGVDATDIADKLVGQLHVLEGGLLAWGTQIVTMVVEKMKSKDKDE